MVHPSHVAGEPILLNVLELVVLLLGSIVAGLIIILPPAGSPSRGSACLTGRPEVAEILQAGGDVYRRTRMSCA